MLHSVPWTTMYQCSLQSKQLKPGTVYILLLLLASLTFSSVQSRPLNRQIDNRSPEIDPFWYVGRGVRPIGRFGKRQSKNISSLHHGVISLELILNALREQEALDVA
ncbi:prolactin-releasing peptide [Microcaecilia unicolor]|uniref:Prolactin-releasing peptide n=1 Tax=Microcaecilia unicolor TaxID=1415580 RepID=A0A6P7X5L1_9AMPH|nr:prolactin-releasing peptide [Microcaecilia unicolor]